MDQTRLTICLVARLRQRMGLARNKNERALLDAPFYPFCPLREY
jgi:hypothetical protein